MVTEIQVQVSQEEKKIIITLFLKNSLLLGFNNIFITQ